MDHIRILRRAFEITRAYRVLWIFGFLVALTTARGGSNPGSGSGNRNGTNGGFPEFNLPTIPQEIINNLIGIGIAVLCLLVILGIGFVLIRYVATTSLVRMVDQYETSGEQLTFKAGWRLGWSQRAFRAWLVELLLGLGIVLLVVLFLLLAGAPLLALLTGQKTLQALGVVTTIGLGFLFILLLFVIVTVVGVLKEFFLRAVILEDLGVMDGIRRGWKLVLRKPGDVALMALILFGLGLGFALVMVMVGLALVLFGLFAGGLPGLAVWALVNQFNQGVLPIVLAVLVGLPVFLLVVVIPITFISGLMEVFTSSIWTLTYRELAALESVLPAHTPDTGPREPAAGPVKPEELSDEPVI